MASKKSYQELKTELDEIIEWFDSSDPNIDEALKKHAQAQAIIKELDKYLSQAKQKIKIKRQ